MENQTVRSQLSLVIIEAVVYAFFLLVYFLTVLRFLAGYLEQLYAANLSVYAVLSLILIVTQAVLLEIVTSIIIRQFTLKNR